MTDGQGGKMAHSESPISLVVLGMHRSGTSAIAGALGLCGAWVGEQDELTATNQQNPKGFFERRDLRTICDKLLHSAGADWWRVSGFDPISVPYGALSDQTRAFRRMVAELDRHGTWVIKEPRLCLLFPVLRSEIPNPVCVHIYRNPLEVAHSLRLRNGYGIAEGIALWEAYNLRALHASEGLSRVLVSYDELVSRPEACLSKLVGELQGLKASGLKVPPAEAVGTFISPDLKRQKFGEDETREFLTRSQFRLWQSFLSGDAFAQTHPKELEIVSRQHLADLESRKYSQLQTARKIARRDEQVNKQSARLEAVAEKLRERADEISLLRAKVSNLDSRITNYKDALKERGLQLKKREKKLESMEKQLSELKVSTKERALENRVLAQQNANLDSHIKDMYASRSWRVTAPLRSAGLAGKWWLRNMRRGFLLMGWLATGQFSRAQAASVPYLERYLPAVARKLSQSSRADSRAMGGRKREKARAEFFGGKPGGGAHGMSGGVPSVATILDDKVRESVFGNYLDKVSGSTESSSFLKELEISERRLAEIDESGSGDGGGGPLVSIVMPTHDRGKIIASAITSVLEQRYKNWELLVCDDASKDNTEEVIEGFNDRRIRYLKLAKGGAAAARNAGLADARGAIIAYLDSDNFWHPGYLAAMVLVLEKNPGRSSAYSSYIDFRAVAGGGVKLNGFHFSEFNHERLLEKNYIDLNTFVHRRELYAQFGGFNENLTRRQDYDLILKYTWLRDPIHVPCLLVMYQRNDTLAQITEVHKHDKSCVGIINGSVEEYFREGLPVASDLPVRKVTIISWDLCRNHFSKAFAVAEALSKTYEVQLVSFRFFEEDIFPPLGGVDPSFETVYLPGGKFPEFFESVRKAVDAIDGDVIYVVKPRMPSLGVALLANKRHGIPLILEINDLETVVSSPTSEDSHAEQQFADVDLANEDLLNPYSDLWSQVMDPIAKQLPVLVTHNKNIDAHFGNRCLYMRNLKDERVYDPEAYGRAEIRAELGFAPTDRVILFGGMLRKHKGIYELVDLVKRLRDPSYKLLFVGSRITPDQEKLMDRFGNQVRVLPPQDRTAMARINLAADLIILWLDPEVPASAYQMPYKATDALAMETSIIANEISDLGDLGRQGYLRIVGFGDWDRMDKVIGDVFENDMKREQRQAAGRRLYLRQFSYAAARSSFRLIAGRALRGAGQVLPAAEAFTERFEDFYRFVSGSPHSLFPADSFTGQLRESLDGHDVTGIREDEFIEVWAMEDLPRLTYRDPHGVAVIMPTGQRFNALRVARRLVKRAKLRARVFIIECGHGVDRLAAFQAASDRLDVKYLVQLTDDAFPGLRWLKRAHDVLERDRRGMLLFNTGGKPDEPGVYAMVRRDWSKTILEDQLSRGRSWEDAWRTLVESGKQQELLTYDAESVLIDTTSKPGPAGTEENLPTTAGESDRSIQVVDVQSVPDLTWSDPDGIAVIMPCINPKKGMATARFLRSRAGVDHRIFVVVDTLRQGFIRTLNRMASSLDVKYIVYLAEDAFPGVDWLKIAHERLERTEKGLLAFNCGKWRGRVAAFGMVRLAWVKQLYGGPVFFEGYEAHKADNELTAIARVTEQFEYGRDSTLVEYDLDKVFLEQFKGDGDLFLERFRSGFGGLASIDALGALAKDYLTFRIPAAEQAAWLSGEKPALPTEDTFVFYRIIGNDLYPRHRKGQALDNLRFILEHEPDLAGCEKRFVLNRILDEEQERQIMALLDQHGHTYMRILFDHDEYRRIGFDTDALPNPGFLSSAKFDALKDVKKERATLAVYRHKNNYVMNNNGARNAALEDGLGRAKWILPWDGNCFLTQEAWDQIRRDVIGAPDKKYFVVPMARMLSNEPLVHGGEIPKAVEEPQIIFRADATERFDAEFCYGRRPKVELLWRLGVEGPWDDYRDDAWDQKRSPVSPEAHQVGRAGWVARLFSGMATLEGNTHSSMLNRGFARSEAIVATLRHLDVNMANADSESPVSIRSEVLERQVPARDEPSLRPVVQTLVAAADEALGRGPFSVTDKTTLPPSGDKHDYWHPAPYWWPNPDAKDGLPYIRKDGLRVPGTRMYEPDSEKYDRTRLQRVFDDSLSLALAWSFTDDRRYVEHGAKILDRFFVDPSTRMNPHLKYGQVRTGHNKDLGAPTGLIEMKDMYYYLDAVRILESAGVVEESVASGFRSWQEEYLQWLLTSDQGRKERAAINNHGTCYDLQVASIASFLGNEELVYSTLVRSQARIREQFTADGKQPDELKRTTTAHYCCFNFQSWINLAEIGSRWGVDLWGYRAPNGAGLAQGARWLLAHMGKSWPYKQIDEFDTDRFHPIWFAAKEKVDDLPISSAAAESLYAVKPLFFPHDGIRPFWNLGSYCPLRPVDRQVDVEKRPAAAPVTL